VHDLRLPRLLSCRRAAASARDRASRPAFPGPPRPQECGRVLGRGRRPPGVRRPRRRRHPRRRRREPPHRLRFRHRGHRGRQLRPRCRRARPAAGRRLHAHLLHGEPLRGVRRGLRAARRADPGAAREAERPVQLGRRGRGERGEDRPHLHRPRRRRRLRARLPRAHEPDDGADREEHALQARLRAVRAGGLPGADGLPAALARRRGAVRRRGVRRVRRHGAHPGGRDEHGCRGHRADPGRGRVRRTAAGVAEPGGGVLPGARHPPRRRRDPDRLLPHR
jgi:hypothetical protein